MTILHDYWRSSAAYRLRIALNLLNEPYEAVPVDLLAGAHKSPQNLARHPQGLVPTLETDGRVLTQSLAIIEYLDETRHAGFLPNDPPGRARVRTLSFAIAMEIHPVCNLSVARHAVEASGGAITIEAWMQRFIRPGLEAVERYLDAPETGTYCHGDAITMADICLVPQLYNAQRWDVQIEDLRRIAEISARLVELPAVAEAHPDKHAPEA